MAIRNEAALMLPPGYHADLDSPCLSWGLSDRLNANYDLVNDGGGLGLKSENGGRIALLEDGERGDYQACVAQVKQSSFVSYYVLHSGDRLCVSTSERREALAIVKTVRSTLQGVAIELEVTTWEQQKGEGAPSENGTDYTFWYLALGVLGAAYIRGYIVGRFRN